MEKTKCYLQLILFRVFTISIYTPISNYDLFIKMMYTD